MSEKPHLLAPRRRLIEEPFETSEFDDRTDGPWIADVLELHGYEMERWQRAVLREIFAFDERGEWTSPLRRSPRLNA